MSDLETIELRVPAHVSALIGQLSRDTGVSRDDVASVLATLALRQWRQLLMKPLPPNA